MSSALSCMVCHVEIRSAAMPESIAFFPTLLETVVKGFVAATFIVDDDDDDDNNDFTEDDFTTLSKWLRRVATSYSHGLFMIAYTNDVDYRAVHKKKKSSILCVTVFCTSSPWCLMIYDVFWFDGLMNAWRYCTRTNLPMSRRMLFRTHRNF